MKVNLTASSRRDPRDWHNIFVRDSIDRFLFEHDIKEQSNIRLALLSEKYIDVFANWLNSKGFAVTVWKLDLGSDGKVFGLDFNENNEYYIEAMLKYV